MTVFPRRPPLSTARSRETLITAARLYYLEGLSQEAAAARLGMTRSNFSRVLRAARETGIVEFRINEGFARDDRLEQALSVAFGLRRAIVATPDDGREPLDSVAHLAASTLAQSLVDVGTVAVSWGTTLQAVVEALPPLHRANLDVVQMVGGLTSFDARASAHDLVRELAQRLNARYHYLNSPAVFDSIAALQALSAEQSVRSTLERARSADVALVGIGNPAYGSSSTLLKLLADDKRELARFWSAKPVGDVCGRYYDVYGNPLRVPGLSDRVLAIDAVALRSIPISIGVATGADKGDAVLGALRGRYVNTLICDTALAQAILLLQR